MNNEKILEAPQVKPYSVKDLENLYGVPRKVLFRWFEPIKIKIGLRMGNYYTPKQIEIIFEHCSFPLQKINPKNQNHEKQSNQTQSKK